MVPANPADSQNHPPVGAVFQCFLHGFVRSWTHLVGGALRNSAAISQTGLGIGYLLSSFKQQVPQDLETFSRFW
jgi:hypothetical protein